MAKTHHSLPQGLLDLPVGMGSQLVALSYLNAADESFKRFTSRGKDRDALHDFRVALRTLRSHLRAYRRCMTPEISKSLLRRVKKLADLTNPTRDLEVEIEQVEKKGDEARWLVKPLQRDFRTEFRHARAGLLKKYPSVSYELHEKFSIYQVKDADERGLVGHTFGLQASHYLQRHIEEFTNELKRLNYHSEISAFHNVRILGKRLRYVLQPLDLERNAIKEAIACLKQLQENLGTLHDTQVLLDTLKENKKYAPKKRLYRDLRRALREEEKQVLNRFFRWVEKKDVSQKLWQAYHSLALRGESRQVATRVSPQFQVLSA